MASKRNMGLCGVVGAGLTMAAAGSAGAVTPVISECERLSERLVAFMGELDGDLAIKGEPKVTLEGEGCRLEISGFELVDGDDELVSDPLWLELQPGSLLDQPAYEATWSLPDRIFAVGPAGEEVDLISIGSQAWSGLWHPGSETLVGVDIEVADINLFFADAGGGDIAKVTMRDRLVPSPETEKNIDWVGEMRIEGVSLRGEAGERLTLDSLTAEGGAHAVPRDVILPILEAGAELRLASESALESGDDSEIEAAMLLYGRKLAALWLVFDGFFQTADLAYHLQGLDVGESEAEAVKIDELRVETTALREADKGLTGGMKLAFSRPPGAFGPEEATEMVPETLKLSFDTSGVPIDKLVSLLVGLEPGTNPETAALLVGSQLLGAAFEQGLRVDLREATGSAPLYGFDAVGDLALSPEAAMMAVGGADVTIENLPALVEWLKTDPGAQESGILQMVTLVQALGQQSEGDNGRPRHSYRLDLDKQGNTTLNGTDLMPLLGMGQQ